MRRSAKKESWVAAATQAHSLGLKDISGVCVQCTISRHHNRFKHKLSTPHSHIQPLQKALLLTGSARGAHRTHPRTQANPPTRAEVHPCIAILHFCTHAPAQHCSCKDHAHMRTNHKANPTLSDPLPPTPERVLGSHVRTQRTINAAAQQPWVAALHTGGPSHCSGRCER